MCFYHGDYDWFASVVERSEIKIEKEILCNECHNKISPGGIVHHIYMQESEWCLTCENEECECTLVESDGDHDCQCEKPDYGETFDYDRCCNCEKFLNAIKLVEVEAGCSPEESQPSLGDMIESLQFDPKESTKYFKKAEELNSGDLEFISYLNNLKEKIFKE